MTAPIPSDVTLRCDVSEPWYPGVALHAAILDGNLLPLAEGDFTPGSGRTLVAKGVPAGTAIVVAFLLHSPTNQS